VKAELSDLLQLAKAGKAPMLSLPGKDPTVGSGTGTGMGTGTGTGRTLAGHKS
jgi:hypothetical protein